MSSVNDVIKQNLKYIKNKKILEVACGSAMFTLKASEFSEEAYCIDLNSSRLDDMVKKENKKIKYFTMDARNMTFEDNCFDNIFLYNAAAHIAYAFEQIICECFRVLKDYGSIIIISSFKIDKLYFKSDTFKNVISRFWIEESLYKNYCIYRLRNILWV